MKQKLDDLLDFNLVKVVNKLRYQIGSQLRHLDITSEQWGVLARLWEQDGFNQKELAEKLLKDQANTTRILDKLVNKGWVQRVDSPDDRRVYLIYLTEKGKRIFEENYPLVSQVKEKLEKGLTDREIESLKAILKRILQNID